MNSRFFLFAVVLGLYAWGPGSFAMASGAGSGLDAFKSDLNREAGAIYLEGLVEKEIKLKVLQPTTVWLSTAGERNMGILDPGREVVLLAMTDKAFRVRGKARHDQVSGWVRPSDLGGLDDEFRANLKKLYERQLLVEDLIANKQVALGMTLDEVARAMGEPTKKSSTINATGRKDTFEYITYKNVPVSTGPNVTGNGTIYNGFTYVKVEDGKVTIEFEDEMVTSISESEGGAAQVAARGRVRVVPRPIVLFR